MPLEPRAVIFDLDDTLYPYRRFRASGFLAVARYLEARTGLDRRLGFRALQRARRGVFRGRELQACLAQYELPEILLPELFDVYQFHAPDLRLPPVVAANLSALRVAGWRLGVLTNGLPSVQAQKVAALGLEPLVDAVVYAATCGSGEGKPDPAAFAAVVRRLGVEAGRSIFVGNDEEADVAGAARAGMAVVCCRVWDRRAGDTAAHATIDRFTALVPVVGQLAEEVLVRHAA